VPDDYDGEIDEPVKVYSNIEKVIAIFGSVLHNDKSRGMYQLMSNNPTKEYYLKEMAVIIEKHENPRLPIYEHHIGVMIKCGIVKIRIKMHNKHKTKYYRIAPIVMITSPVLYEKAVKSKTLRNAFRQVFKFAVIGIATLTITLSHSYYLQENSWKPTSLDLSLFINETTILISALVFTSSLLIFQNLNFFMKKFTSLKR